MNITIIFFGILSILAVASALFTITSKHPVHSAFSLVFHFFMLAGLYFTLNAQFIAVIQVLVYAGAIMVLVIFVIMLLNLGSDASLKLKYRPAHVLAVLLSIGLVGLLLTIILTTNTGLSELPVGSDLNSSVENLGQELYSKFVFPVIAISLLLCVAIVGAIVLAKRKLD